MYWEQIKDRLQKAIAKSRFGLVTDLDGTISPIVDHPAAACVSPRNLELLAALRKYLSLTAVLSGRSAEDVAGRIGLLGLVYVGNHGMEIWQDGMVQVSPQAAAYRPALERALPEIKKISVSGMLLEDKGTTLSVHYRQTSAPQEVKKTLSPQMQWIADMFSLNLTYGRMVFEFRPPVQIDKGTAFISLIQAHNLEAVIYLGDDTTDVVAFQAAQYMRARGGCQAYAGGVESSGTPQAVLSGADFLIQGVSGVESFLDWLLKVCIASST